jgi:ribosome maturation factor RimP
LKSGRSAHFFCLKKKKKIVHTTQIEKIKQMVELLLEGRDLFLVDVEMKGTKVPEIWILLDKESTDIRIDECTEVSRELALQLDANELFGNKYRLNVSSPGMSKPLSDLRQYPKHIGRKAKVHYKSIEDESHQKVEVTFLAMNERTLRLQQEKSEPFELDFDQIVEFKILPSFN